jgi:DNA-binding beta-propeller fold protein YncE
MVGPSKRVNLGQSVAVISKQTQLSIKFFVGMNPEFLPMSYADRRVSLTVKFQSFMVNVHAEISTVA